MSVWFRSRSAWCLFFLASLLPFLYLLVRIVSNDLGVEPGIVVLEHLGTSAIVFLLITLAVSPIKRWLGVKWLLGYRRMFGLYCLFYAFLHVLSYGLFIVEWHDFVGSLYKRPYVVMGALAFSILIALGITSPKFMVKKMGRRWKSLHRLIYLSAAFIIVHVWWQSRSDFLEAFLYLMVFFLLMLARVNLRPKMINK